MAPTTQELIDLIFHAFQAKDLEAVMACFADDALLYDPHYPVPEMKGKAAIRQGLAWGLGNMERPGFVIRHLWIQGDTAAVELDTHHIFKGGMEVKFPQVFIMETRDGSITRLQSYVPYSPPGIAGLLGKVTRLAWRLQGKLR
jgi:ketosteroid isomerase-like protein